MKKCEACGEVLDTLEYNEKGYYEYRLFPSGRLEKTGFYADNNASAHYFACPYCNEEFIFSKMDDAIDFLNEK